MNTKYIVGLWCMLGLVLNPAYAHDAAGESVASVEKEMHETWDKPGVPLVLPVIVIHHGMAIADWVQGEKGGRALLKFHAAHEHWHTLLCGGAELTTPQRLEEAGMTSPDARTLALALQQQEQKGLSAEQRQLIDSFSGIVLYHKGQPVSSTGHENHGSTHSH